MTERPVPEGYYAGAYWGPRKESPEECAQRAAGFLNLLAPHAPLLAHWYKPSRSAKDARKHPLMPPDVPTLTDLFRRGVNRERGGPAIEQLGYTLWFDNGGGKFDRAGLQILCGCYSEAVSNACVLTLPTTGPEAERVCAVPVLAGAVRSMAMTWDPDWAVATSDSFRRLMRGPSKSSAFVGWVTYLSRRRGMVPPLPAPVRVEPVEDKGTLIILTPERLTATNPELIEQGRRVGELLSRAGLMQPVTP